MTPKPPSASFGPLADWQTPWPHATILLGDTLPGIPAYLGYILMRDLDDLFAALAKSPFRSRFQLNPKDRAYLVEKTLPVILDHGRKFLLERLAPAEPKNDGRQTPMRGHPIFVAQHATAICCRGCLEKWHRIQKGQPLTDEQIDGLLAVLAHWLRGQMGKAASDQSQ